MALVALQVLSALLVLLYTDWTRRGFVTGDNFRYRQIARAAGWPYRDHAVEFPPVSWLYVKLIASWGSRNTTGRLLVLTQLFADLGTAAALFWGFGRRAAEAWLALMIPFLWTGWIFARLDLLSVAIATLGVVLVWRRAERSGGAVIGVAGMAKAWAVTLVPGLFAVGRRRAMDWAVGLLALISALWLAVGGLDGVREVVTFRDAKGWQIESTFGGLVLLLTGDRPRGESGAWRIGVQPGWTKPLLAVALVAAIAGTWWLVRRVHAATEQAFFYGAVASVLATLVLAPIISPQYLVWFLPFVAVLWRDRALVVMTTLALLATAVVAHWYTQFRQGELWLVLLLNGRNVLLWAITGLALARLLSVLGELPARVGVPPRQPLPDPATPAS